MLRSHLLRGGSACVIALTFVLPARGQEALPAIDIAGQTSHGSAAGTGDRPARSGGRETGYNQTGPVSASKTNIPILETPYAVQIVPRETMDDRQAVTVLDALFTNVSSISGAAGYYDSLVIRGFDSGGQLYRNGLRQQNTSNFETTNLQSIEVLKGPAAMLFGRVEPGGLINFVPKRPQSTPYYSIQEQAGAFGTTRTSINATGPLTADKTLLYRLNTSYLDKNHFQPNVWQGNLLVAPTITWKPTDRFTLNIDGEYHRVYFTDVSTIPAIGFRPAKVPISTYLIDPTFAAKFPNFQERTLFAFDWTYEFADDWRMTNRFAYTNVDYRQRGPGLDSLNEATGEIQRSMWLVPVPGAPDSTYYRRSYATNIDLEGKARTGPFTHRLLAGFDYYGFESRSHGHCCDSISSINLYNPVYTPIVGEAFTANYRVSQKEKWTGLYLQDQISFWDDRVQLLLGGRHDWAESSRASTFDSEPFAITDARRVIVPLSANSPRVGLLLRPLPWLSLYGNYTRSYGASNGIDSQNRPLKPQIGVQFEGGVKAELLDGKLTATLAYFDIEKKNLTVPVANTQFVTTVGAARSNGVEFDVTGRIDDNWSVIATFSHLDARITRDDDSSGGGGDTGKRLSSVPHNTGNLWAKYQASGEFEGLTLGGGVYVDKAFGDNANSFELPAYARVDAMASYKFKAALLSFAPDLTFQINVTNLLDTTYYQGANGRMSITPGAPRAFLASIRAEF
ncbi:MAG TPA: TonB-dependent siderophore receptor [Methylosinus sp.]|jgi:iron complex outermembrane receptor protein|uniref:TonB-dependent siderophore receptor n=1 Tax=Methylosinus sp. TaxID=427 RepID=UPI002F91EC10